MNAATTARTRARVALAALTVAATGLILLTPGLASAHPAGVQPATDFRTSVRGVTPVVRGLSVRFVADGSRLELTNASAQGVDVIGYEGERMLRVTRSGVWENRRSPSVYLDQPTNPDAARADAAAAPQWRKVSGGATARWHDHRTVWHGRPPPLVEAHRERLVHVLDWSVPLRSTDSAADGASAGAGGADGSTDTHITGRLDWLPPPNATNWWSGIVLAAVVLGGLGLVRTRAETRSANLVRYALAGLSGVVGVCALGYAVAVAVENAAPGVQSLAGELVNQIWPITTGLAALAACAVTLARRPAADFALALAGASVALMAGLGNAAVLRHSVPPVPVQPITARLIVATVVAGAVGLTLACAVRMYRESAPPPPMR